MSWNRTLKRVKQRDWAEIASHWFEIIQRQGPRDAAPTRLADLGAVLEVTSAVPEVGDSVSLSETAAVRQVAFATSAYLDWKAEQLLDCSVEVARKGVPSVYWASSLGYLSALLSARALLQCFGVAWFSSESHTYFIDIWHVDTPKPQQRKGRIYPMGIRAERLSQRVGHAQMWELLERLLSTTQNLPSVEPIRVLKELDVSRISRLRHRVQYDDAFNVMEVPEGGNEIESVEDMDPQFARLVAETLLAVHRCLVNELLSV